jgi:ketosteroid isomerase-like protein
MSAEVQEIDWLTGLFAAIDAKDTPRFVDFLTEDATFRFGSAPAATGREAIAHAVGGFFDTIAGLSHTVDKVWSGSGTLMCEGDVCYTRHDGSQVTIPFADAFDMRGDKISGYRIYIDISPLYTE